MSKKVKVKIELEGDEAWVMAQFIKRLGWNDVHGCAVDDEFGGVHFQERTE